MKKLFLSILMYGALTVPFFAQELIPSAMAEWHQHNTPTLGEVRIPLFYIEFKDVKYPDTVVPLSDIGDYVFNEDNKDSITSFYSTASYGNLHLTGDVYTYTTKFPVGRYEVMGYEVLAMEIMENFDDQVDYSSYDADGDGYMDALVICVPIGGDAEFWYGFKMMWHEYEYFSIDGVKPANYVICDSMAEYDDMDYFYSTLYHELGHCMGLPDYYKYGVISSDDEAMNGYAGYEMMDEMSGDFSQFSKIQLGWLREDQVQVFDGNEKKTFEIPKVAQGGCVVVFPKNQENKKNFQSEYFIIEYNTPEGRLEGMFPEEKSGVRVMHVQAECKYSDGSHYYRYNNHSSEYDTSHNGIRVIRRINDRIGFYKAGDKVTYGEHDFKWYKGVNGGKFEISIDAIDDEKATVSIIPF